MSNLLDLPSWKLGTGDLIQQAALLAWLNKGDEGKEVYKFITECRVWNEVFARLTKEREIEQLQAECYLGIADYVKKNPRATEAQMTAEVTKRIEIFAEKVKNM